MRRPRPAALVLAVLAVAMAVTACNPSTPPAAHAPCSVGIVGDSLIVGIQIGNRAVNQFAARGCGVAFIDARTGRPTSEGVAIVQGWAAAGRLPAILVVGLGTNDGADGPAFGRNIDAIMTAAGGRPVVWINVDRAATEAVLNPEIVAAQARYPNNLWIMDWNHFIDLNPMYRGPDQIHPTSTGYDIRAAQLAEMVTGR